MSKKWAFHCGSQVMDWIVTECTYCKHFVPASEPGTGCPIEERVSLASIVGNDVSVPDELTETGNYHTYKCSRKEYKE